MEWMVFLGLYTFFFSFGLELFSYIIPYSRIGPTALTEGTISNKIRVNTVTDNLFNKGKIAKNQVGIFFRPATSGSGKGEIIWGGIDTTKIVGSVHYVPITNTQPASFYWGISQTIQYGGKDILSHTQGTSCLQRTALSERF
jgi:hypothetical protein